jgi:hypothetical protein
VGLVEVLGDVGDALGELLGDRERELGSERPLLAVQLGEDVGEAGPADPLLDHAGSIVTGADVEHLDDVDMLEVALGPTPAEEGLDEGRILAELGQRPLDRHLEPDASPTEDAAQGLGRAPTAESRRQRHVHAERQDTRGSPGTWPEIDGAGPRPAAPAVCPRLGARLTRRGSRSA